MVLQVVSLRRYMLGRKVQFWRWDRVTWLCSAATRCAVLTPVAMSDDLSINACTSGCIYPESTHHILASLRQVTLYRLSADGSPAMVAILPAPLERVEDLQLNADTIAFLADGNDAPPVLMCSIAVVATKPVAAASYRECCISATPGHCVGRLHLP